MLSSPTAKIYRRSSPIVNLRPAQSEVDHASYRDICLAVYGQLGAVDLIEKDKRFDPNQRPEVHLLEEDGTTVGGFIIEEVSEPATFWAGVVRSEGALPDPRELLRIGRVFQFVRLVIELRFRGNFRFFVKAEAFISELGRREGAAYATVDAVLPWRVHHLYYASGFRFWSPPFQCVPSPCDRLEDRSNGVFMVRPLNEIAARAFRPDPVTRARVDEIADQAAAICAHLPQPRPPLGVDFRSP